MQIVCQVFGGRKYGVPWRKVQIISWEEKAKTTETSTFLGVTGYANNFMAGANNCIRRKLGRSPERRCCEDHGWLASHILSGLDCQAVFWGWAYPGRILGVSWAYPRAWHESCNRYDQIFDIEGGENMDMREEKKQMGDQIKGQNFWDSLSDKNAEWGINYQVVGLCVAMVAGVYLLGKIVKSHTT